MAESCRWQRLTALRSTRAATSLPIRKRVRLCPSPIHLAAGKPCSALALITYLTTPSTPTCSSSPWACNSRLPRSEEHTSELQSQFHLVCRLLLEKKNRSTTYTSHIHSYTRIRA